MDEEDQGEELPLRESGRRPTPRHPHRLGRHGARPPAAPPACLRLRATKCLPAPSYVALSRPYLRPGSSLLGRETCGRLLHQPHEAWAATCKGIDATRGQQSTRGTFYAWNSLILE
eukprot:scaffold2004_cov420-Prasinococcus_capsulatus_cf.AAC.18